MITQEQITNRIIKKDLQVADTKDSKQFFEESLSSGFLVNPLNIWSQYTDIPTTAPTLIHNTSAGVVKRYVDVSLTPIEGSPNAFHSEFLENSIPFNFGDGSYNYVLKDANDTVIPFGSGSWYVDNIAGVVRFYDNVPTTNLPPKISFYKYIGTTGLAVATSLVDIDLYISPTNDPTNAGDDNNGDGTSSSPFATLTRCYEEISTYDSDSTIRIHLLGNGDYRITEQHNIYNNIPKESFNIALIGDKTNGTEITLTHVSDRVYTHNVVAAVDEFKGHVFENSNGTFYCSGNTETELTLTEYVESGLFTKYEITTNLFLDESIANTTPNNNLRLENLNIISDSKNISGLTSLVIEGCNIKTQTHNTDYCLTVTNIGSVECSAVYSNTERIVDAEYKHIIFKNINELDISIHVAITYSDAPTFHTTGIILDHVTFTTIKHLYIENVFTALDIKDCFRITRKPSIKASIHVVNCQVGFALTSGIEVLLCPTTKTYFDNTNYVYYPKGELYNTAFTIGNVVTNWLVEHVMSVKNLEWSTCVNGTTTIADMQHISDTNTNYNTFRMLDESHNLFILIDGTFPERSGSKEVVVNVGETKSITVGRKTYNSLIKINFELECETSGTLSYGSIVFSCRSVVLRGEPIIQEFGGFLDSSVDTFSCTYDTSYNELKIELINTIDESFTLSYSIERNMLKS